ncbi:MAG: PTS sugar transporter subunit IIA [Kiritimatiellia bacterium]
MAHQLFNSRQAAEFLHIPEETILRLAKRDEIPHHKRGDVPVFVNLELEAWASRRILTLRDASFATAHGVVTRELLQGGGNDRILNRLCPPEHCTFEFAPKTARGALRDMAAFAGATGLLYDESDLFRQLSEREDAASTALPGGIALLHPANHDPYLISDSFVLLARSVRPIYFGAPDDRPTDLFFLVCAQGNREHLHILGRLARIFARMPELPDRLREASEPIEACRALYEAEDRLVAELARSR